MEKTIKQAPVAVNKRKLEGIVTSNKMMKTIVVSVTRTKTNEKYNKQYKTNTKFKAHDENGEAQIGDMVVIEETRPISRDKRWRLISITKKAAVAENPASSAAQQGGKE